MKGSCLIRKSLNIYKLILSSTFFRSHLNTVATQRIQRTLPLDTISTLKSHSLHHQHKMNWLYVALQWTFLYRTLLLNSPTVKMMMLTLSLFKMSITTTYHGIPPLAYAYMGECTVFYSFPLLNSIVIITVITTSMLYCYYNKWCVSLHQECCLVGTKIGGLESSNIPNLKSTLEVNITKCSFTVHSKFAEHDTCIQRQPTVISSMLSSMCLPKNSISKNLQ